MSTIGKLFSKKKEIPKEEPVEEKDEVSAEKLPKILKFIVISTYGELLDVAIQLEKVEGYDTYFCVLDHDYEKIGDGIVTKEKDWFRCIGKGYIWVIDGCEHADMQDWLREQGEYVVGTNKALSEMEDNRQKGQAWFKKAGFKQPESVNFQGKTAFDDAMKFISERKEKFIIKQNGSAPKSLNYKGKFDGQEDILYHLEEMRKGWRESEYGPVDFDLMEVVEGMEVAASAFFNGHDWLRNREGKVAGYINFEHKKLTDGDLGPSTGEMGTLFKGVTEDDEGFADIMLRKEIVEFLKEKNYRGVFDINGCSTKDGYVAFEATSRFGIPATSYEFMEGLKSNTGRLLAAMAMGIDEVIEIDESWGIAQVIVAPPFPVEDDVEDNATSRGEKLWIIKSGKPAEDFIPDQWHHIHLENFERNEEGDYLVATKNGYLLVITAKADSIKEAREKALEYIKDNIFIADMFYRQDLGERIEKQYEAS